MIEELTDSGYILWANKEQWTRTEAIYLLHGCVPPGVKEPNARGEEIVAFPGSWIYQASIEFFEVGMCWEAIFHECLSHNLEYLTGEEQEYSRFIRILVTDELTPLEMLTLYVMELPRDQLTDTSENAKFIREELDELFLRMNTTLGLNERLSTLPSVTVSPRLFIQEYCRFHPGPYNRFTRWGQWLTDHQELAVSLRLKKPKVPKIDRIKSDTAEPKATKTNPIKSDTAEPKATKTNPIKSDTAEPKATKTNLIKSLMLRYLDETNGQNDFIGCIEYLLQNNVRSNDDKTRFYWNDYNLKPQDNIRKTMQNLFRDRLKEWNQQNSPAKIPDKPR